MAASEPRRNRSLRRAAEEAFSWLPCVPVFGGVASGSRSRGAWLARRSATSRDHRRSACGFLAGGFARFQCERCRHEHLLAFSCKARAICPSGGGRRMAERAAHLVDHVFPGVSVRQWVLTLPHRVRYVLAWDHVLCRAVMRIFMTAVLGSLRRRARRTQGVAGGRSGDLSTFHGGEARAKGR